ncbi:hypothetical protein [Pseudomonas putida]
MIRAISVKRLPNIQVQQISIFGASALDSSKQGVPTNQPASLLQSDLLRERSRVGLG